MARHEFGIMKMPPERGLRYDRYEPQKFNCISVDDKYIEDIIESFADTDTYWHTTDKKGKGLEYCGITLIPPESLGSFYNICISKNGLSELCRITETALAENKWIIHFGI